MSLWLTCARNATIAWAALTLFAAIITHLLAAVFGFDPRFAEPAAFWCGHPLYNPWAFLTWGLSFAPQRPWIALLCLLLALICVLAAFAVLALAGLLAPTDLPRFKSRRGFCCWDKMSQHRLLAANGLALGAASRFAGLKPTILYAAAGNAAFVGSPRFSDASLIAAASAWPGALVFVDAQGIAGNLKRRDIARFAPDRCDSVSLNPLLAIRGGPHAWTDARLLAQALLGTADAATVDAFAVAILDQLNNAPLYQRNLTSLRARLGQPHRVLTEISAAWPEEICRAPAPHCEIARAVRAWRKYPNAALAHLAKIDDALAFLSDGTYADVTAAHQLWLADLVSAEGPRTLALAFPRINGAHAAPLMAALLAQLVAACAMNADTDQLGRPKKRELLIVVEAEALKLLADHAALTPLTTLAGAGCRLLVQATSLADVPQGASDMIAAVGPQTESSAETLSKRGGEISEWRLLSRDERSIRAWALPSWARVERPIVSTDDLIKADAAQTMVFVGDLPPIGARSICIDGPPATFLSGANLSPVRHDWEAAPASPDVSAASSSVPTAPPTTQAPIGAQIRATLSRRAPPRTKPRAAAP